MFGLRNTDTENNIKKGSSKISSKLFSLHYQSLEPLLIFHKIHFLSNLFGTSGYKIRHIKNIHPPLSDQMPF